MVSPAPQEKKTASPAKRKDGQFVISSVYGDEANGYFLSLWTFYELSQLPNVCVCVNVIQVGRLLEGTNFRPRLLLPFERCGEIKQLNTLVKY